MVPKVSIEAMPCPDPACVDGVILVHNAYSDTPLEPEKQICDRCHGRSYIVCEPVIGN